jgi:hypothetical protein
MKSDEYDCPECDNTMVETNTNTGPMFVCVYCYCVLTKTALEIIEKFKQQIHAMRNCSNCANSFYEDGGDDSCFVTVNVNECIDNDWKHWKFEKVD